MKALIKILRVFLTFRHPLHALLDRLGKLEAPEVIHTLRNGLRFHCRPHSSDLLVLFDIHAEREYQPRDLPQFALRPGWTVLDLGANIGAFAVWAAHQGARVTAYEAMGDNYQLLARNIETNGLQAVLHLAPVSGVQRTAVMQRAAGSSSFHWEGQSGVELETVPIGQVLAPFDRIEFLKMDIEGEEFAVFDALEPYHFRRIDRLVMEYHNYGTLDHRTLIRKLRANGYDVWDRAKNETFGVLFAIRKDVL